MNPIPLPEPTGLGPHSGDPYHCSNDHPDCRICHECIAYEAVGENIVRIDVVFDGPPSHESGRFVEVENIHGASVSHGEWIDRGNGLWALRFWALRKEEA